MVTPTLTDTPMNKAHAIETIHEVMGYFRDEDGNFHEEPLFYSLLADEIVKAVNNSGLSESVTEALNSKNGTYRP